VKKSNHGAHMNESCPTWETLLERESRDRWIHSRGEEGGGGGGGG